MMAANDFEIKLASSRVYEIAVSRWLQAAKAYHILPTYDYSGLGSGKAPRLLCEQHGLVIPDLLGAKDGGVQWFEVKLKAKAVVHRKTWTLVTGMSLRHFQHYQQVRQLTGAHVWVLFIHDEENVVRYGEIGTHLDPAHPNTRWSHTWEKDTMDRGGTIFFRFNDLPVVMPKTELDKFKES